MLCLLFLFRIFIFHSVQPFCVRKLLFFRHSHGCHTIKIKLIITIATSYLYRLFRFNTPTNFKILLNSCINIIELRMKRQQMTILFILSHKNLPHNSNAITTKHNEKEKRHFWVLFFFWSILSVFYFICTVSMLMLQTCIHIPKPGAWCTCMHSKQWIFCEVVHSRKHLESIPIYQFPI